MVFASPPLGVRCGERPVLAELGGAPNHLSDLWIVGYGRRLADREAQRVEAGDQLLPVRHVHRLGWLAAGGGSIALGEYVQGRRKAAKSRAFQTVEGTHTATSPESRDGVLKTSTV